MTDDLARLMAEDEILKKDAERYRWLRKGHGDKLTDQNFWCRSDDDIDAAIDTLKGEPK